MIQVQDGREGMTTQAFQICVATSATNRSPHIISTCPRPRPLAGHIDTPLWLSTRTPTCHI